MRLGLGAALLLGYAVSGCLAENPSGSEGSDTDGGSSETASTPQVDNMLGCPAGESCWVVLVAQALDDRVEVFGGLAGATPSYRGGIDLDLKPGTEIGPLDEPFGMALSEEGLHVITGHYPSVERGAMLTFPQAFFDERDAALIPDDSFFAGGAFSEGVVETRFEQTEPIFALSRPVSGKVLVSVFANDLFAIEDTWTIPGKLAVIDASNPADFALITLTGLEDGDCLGASQLILLGDEQTAAVACDGNEAIAFLDLGDMSGSPAEAAAGVTGKLCDLPFQEDRRTRYLAHDGAGGVLVGVGPTPLNGQISSQLYNVTPANCGLSPISVGASDAQLGELVRFGESHWLLAQGALAPDGMRGVQVISSTGICNTLPGLDDAWQTEGNILAPYALAVAPGGEHLAIGAAPSSVGSGQNGIYGKVLWATLEGVEDPCTMTAQVVDLGDGGAGHGPAPLPADPSTWRRGPNVVVVAQVEGGA
ncbi:MAG: hypothetical protein KUG77_11680 [Nannocystaceae bacterium]|nr:hypothetical protein [Nannocystaceae bacterium]